MIIKKYTANNINEAMTRIQFELGKDAVIVSQKKVRKPGILGFFSSKLIEVTATVENSREEEAVTDYESKEEVEFKKSIEDIKRIMGDENLFNNVSSKKDNNIKLSQNINDRISDHNRNVEKVKDSEPKDDITEVKKEVSEIKGMLNKVIENTSKPIGNSEENNFNEKSLIKEKLDNWDIDLSLYDTLINEIDENGNIDEQFRDIVERDILVNNKDLSGRVVLVGPTGVGKTTTIAKLAGRLALVEKKNIGLITVDTYRIGAIEQLKTYAEIMNIPFSVVISTKEMEEALDSMKDCDVVLIDTTGRSSKNAMQISELRAFIQKVNPTIVNMVISATTKNKDLKTILEGYSSLGYNNLIITKLDETTTYGCIYNISKFANRPISFITTGQNVPDDIRIPTKEDMARFILGEETVC